MKRRTLSLLLAFVMVFSLFPIAAGANQPEVGHIMSHGEYPALKLETDMVVLCPEEEYAYVTFTPENDGTYVFHSVFSGDTFGELFEADWQRLDTSDDCDNHFFHDYYDFCITYELKAGQTYILGAKFLDDSAGEITVRVDRDHSYEIVSYKEPTCTEEGEAIYECTRCGYGYTQVLDPEHDYELTVIKEPTCTEEGEGLFICTRCGYSHTDVLYPEHDFVWTLTKEPTCTEEGEEKAACIRCGYSFTESIDPQHNFEWTVTKEPTCTEEGEEKATCLVCGYSFTESIDPEHDYKWEVITWPTCTEEGEEKATCIHCGHSYTEVLEPEHTYDRTVTKEPTCTEEGELKVTCLECGYSFTEVIDPEHGYEPTVTKAPTYTEAGEAIYTCIYCGDSYVDSVSPILYYEVYEDDVVVYCSYDDAYPVSEIVIPAEYEGLPVAMIGVWAFNDCDSLKSVIIPDSITMIGYGAFYNCDGLASITIPSSVDYIGTWAFGDCENLSSIYFDGDAPEFRVEVFGGITATAYYPGGNPTWTEDVMQDYGGDITWVAYNPNSPFYDVPVGAFYEAPVSWALENGITTGASATSFNPNGSCLRAQVVTFLHRAEGNPAPASTRNPFTDVKSADFFYKPVLWAVEKKITNGTSATTFGSFDTCNRAAVVTFLWRAAGSPEPKSTRNPFVDVKAGDFFYKPVLWAVENGITTGVDATHFGPTSSCNRAQVVTFLYRAYN